MASALYLISLTTLLLLLIGYRAYRTDHMTQIPMFLKQLDPTLYTRDWFFEGSGQFCVRKVFISFELGLYNILGRRIEWMLFLQFGFCLLGSVIALWATCRVLKKGYWLPLAWIFVLGCLNSYAGLAGTRLFDDITIPRIYPYMACLLSVPLILTQRYVAAGLLLGGTGLFQGAPSLQFLPVAIIWIFSLRGMRGGWKSALMLATAFLLCYWPQFIMARDLLKTKLYSPAEVIHWLAYVRHPHHMLPLHFRPDAYVEMLVLLGFVWSRLRLRKIDAQSERILNLSGVLLAYLLVAVVFICVIPIADWIIFQPMRIVSTFRIFVLFFVAEHLLELLQHRRRFHLLRAAFLIIALINAKKHPEPFTILLLCETLYSWIEANGRTATYETITKWLLLISQAAWLPMGITRTGFLVLFWAALALPVDPIHYWLRRLAWRPSRARIATALVLPQILFYGLLTSSPFQGWESNPGKWSWLQKAHYRFALAYQFHPFPDGALERAALWTRDHTPNNALFLIPPSTGEESFHIWSHRSVVFNAKMFPYLQDEWPNWIARYYAMGGAPAPSLKAPHTYDWLKDSPGTAKLAKSFSSLPERQIVAIARSYQAEFVLSPSDAPWHSDSIRPIAGPFYSTEEQLKTNPTEPGLWVFEVLPEK